jgi:HEPN domain-containing protein
MSHSVRDLLEYAAEIDSTLVQLKSARRLDDYYIPTRYPNGLPGGVPSQYYDDVDEAKNAISLCDSVVTGVAKRLGLVE